MDRVSTKVVTDLDGQKKLASYNQTQGKVIIQTIRDEEEYMKHLGTIIQRDYFPDFFANRDSDVSQNVSGIEQSDVHPINESRNPEKKDPSSVNLDNYLANNTTEDDASFAELIEEAEKKRRIKMSTFFPSVEAAAVSDSNEPKPLALTSGSRVHVGRRLTLGGTNPVHFNPDGVSQTHDELLDHLSKERRIMPSNTRFKRPYPPGIDKRCLARHSFLSKMGYVGLDGKESQSTLSTPQAAGFRFIDASPSPALSAFGASPLMTWGELDATPSRLDDGTGTPSVVSGVSAFRIPSPSKREQLAHKLADKASRQRVRDRNEAVKRVHSGMVSPASRSLLSPAARRLLANTTSSILSGNLSRPGTGSFSHRTFTQSPMNKSQTPRRLLSMDLGLVRRPSSSCDGVVSPSPTTPATSALPSTQVIRTNMTDSAVTATASISETNSTTPSITDNLLNLRSHT